MNNDLAALPGPHDGRNHPGLDPDLDLLDLTNAISFELKRVRISSLELVKVLVGLGLAQLDRAGVAVFTIDGKRHRCVGARPAVFRRVHLHMILGDHCLGVKLRECLLRDAKLLRNVLAAFVLREPVVAGKAKCRVGRWVRDLDHLQLPAWE